MKKQQARLLALVTAAVALAAVWTAARTIADPGGRQAKTKLNGWQEVPAVVSSGRGDFNARIDDSGTIVYTLQYEKLEGATTTMAHIHVGQPGVAGGVSAFLCGGGGKPACPNKAGVIAGVIVAADVAGPAAQGVDAGELADLIGAIRNHSAYVNVHTDKFPNGEIRGHLK